MNNFNIFNPVNLHFGTQAMEQLKLSAPKYGSKALLIYGRNSIKSSGLYSKILKALSGIEIVEFRGIKPNPRLEEADAAAALARTKKVDFIVAVGGGSVIDTAKMVSIGACVNHSIWDFMTGQQKPEKSLPLLSVLTLAATGTEMNPYAVLQNESVGQKIGYASDLIYPKESFLNPEFTLSVDAANTAYGLVDTMAHSMEAFFGKGDAPLPDRLVFSILQEVLEIGPLLMTHLQSYELRARMMYASTMALNGTTDHGRNSGDWGVHALAHELSLLFDMPHGASLSIVYPAWMELMSERAEKRITELGSALFGAYDAQETAAHFRSFFRQIGSPVSLSDWNISVDQQELILNQYLKNKPRGSNYKLDSDDYRKLIEWMA